MSPLCLHKVTQRTVNYKNYTAELLKTKTNQNNNKKKSCAFDMTVHSILDISVEAWTQLNVLEQNLMLTSKEKIFKKGKD